MSASGSSPNEERPRADPPQLRPTRHRWSGGLSPRLTTALALVALLGFWLWVWKHHRRTSAPEPRTASRSTVSSGASSIPSTPGPKSARGSATSLVPQPDGTLIIPPSDPANRGSEPMVLVPISARPTPPPPPPSELGPGLLPPALSPLAPALTSSVATNSAPAFNPAFSERLLKIQVALARHGVSCGSLDGVMGSQTRAALRAFQRNERLPATGTLDDATLAKLDLEAPLYTNYEVSADDATALQPLGKTWLAKSQQSSLAYETLLELVAERTHSNPKLVRWLNPDVDWDRVGPGTQLRVLQAAYPDAERKAAFLRISLGERKLQAFDVNSNLLAHFPCSIAARVDKRPLGEELHIAAIAPSPNYTFDPAVFPESPEARELGRKLILQPGPNNPVGSVWFSLDKPGYGIHGTPRPEDVGRTESHGCFRLANWNAEHLLKLVSVGTPVAVDP